MSLKQMLDVTCPSLTDPRRNTFTTHPLLQSGHLQTFYASLYADHIHKSRVEYEREYIETPDGGIVSLDWTKLPNSPSSNRVPYVLICHGLSGGSHETYVQDLIIVLKYYGYEAIVMNFRGCSDTPVKSAQLYSGSFTGDLELSVDHILKKDPNAVLFGAGFSLGANILLKYAGKMGKNCPMIGLLSIGNPYDFLGSLRAMERSILGRNIYSFRMGSSLKKLLFKHSHAFVNAEWLDFEQVRQSSSVLEFDAAATSKSFGYRTVHEYYRFGSCAFDIPYIEVPTLLLSALDDPIVDKEVIPYFEVKSNPNIILATTKYGGHLGWFEEGFESFVPKNRWFAKPVSEFIHAIVESHLSLPPMPRKVHHDTGTPWYSIPSSVKEDRQKLRKLSELEIMKLHAVADRESQTFTGTEESESTLNKSEVCIKDEELRSLPLENATPPKWVSIKRLCENAKESIKSNDPKNIILKYFFGHRWNFIFFLLGYVLRKIKS
jgi:predicted alpha/beta-fold hydrolase